MLVLFATTSIAHTIYAPNDIQLLDNRFRIDPNTKQVTIILNHPGNRQIAVLVQPDGSKLFAKRHPKKSVAWISSRDQEIITIQNPMPGPWQAIATLHGDNRIQLLSPIVLKVEKLPLKVYRYEYLTTHASLLEDDVVMTDKSFLINAKLTASLVGKGKKLIALYKDDGQHYDSLPFDGKLTTHIFMDLAPSRYLLSIKTRNNIFLRSYNVDMVVFPSPLSYDVQQLEDNADRAKFTFTVDDAEIEPNSVIIDSVISTYSEDNSEQLILHLADQTLTNNVLSVEVPLTHELYTYSGKVFATTKSGRDISFQLPERTFELIPPPQAEIIEINNELAIASAANATASEAMATDEITEEQSSYLWIILSSLIFLIIVGVLITLFLIKRKQKHLATDNGLSLDELTTDQLEPTKTDENEVKK